MIKTLEDVDGKILQEVESGMFTWDDIIDRDEPELRLFI